MPTFLDFIPNGLHMVTPLGLIELVHLFGPPTLNLQVPRFMMHCPV